MRLYRFLTPALIVLAFAPRADAAPAADTTRVPILLTR